MMKWNKSPHLAATIAGLLVSLPVAILAAGAWLRHHPYGYEVGDMLYHLGFPLTSLFMWSIPLTIGHLRPQDYWWAITVMTVLLTTQWIVWGNLIAFLAKKLQERKTDSNKALQSDAEYRAPER